MTRKDRLKLVDLFCGMGCASMGFKKAGFVPVVALEIDPSRCDLYRKNIGISPIQADVMNVSGKDLLYAGGLRKGGMFCMVGCPPCQSFSSLADTKGTNKMFDVRSKYVQKFAQLAVEMKPLVVVFENVQGMIWGAGKKFFDEYIEILDNAGYKTCHHVVNAADFGVPQNRKRVIAVSIKNSVARKKILNEIECFLHSTTTAPCTVGDKIKDLMPLEPGESDPDDPHHSASMHGPKVQEIINNIPINGGSRKNLPKKLWLNCHKRLTGGAEASYGRMRWNDQAPTITCRCTTPACGRFTHPYQNRGITIREAARLQTIPDHAKLSEYKGKNEAIIGDAVPVLLAQKIAEKLQDVVG